MTILRTIGTLIVFLIFVVTITPVYLFEQARKLFQS